MTEQGTAVDQVVPGRLERIGQDVMAADLDLGRLRAGQESGISVGVHDVAGRPSLGGQPAGHRAGPGANLEADRLGQRAERGQPIEGWASYRSCSRRRRASSSSKPDAACTYPATDPAAAAACRAHRPLFSGTGADSSGRNRLSLAAPPGRSNLMIAHRHTRQGAQLADYERPAAGVRAQVACAQFTQFRG
jgi:hypothetical protein